MKLISYPTAEPTSAMDKEVSFNNSVAFTMR